jgi:hypothetical protein
MSRSRLDRDDPDKGTLGEAVRDAAHRVLAS